MKRNNEGKQTKWQEGGEVIDAQHHDTRKCVAM